MAEVSLDGDGGTMLLCNLFLTSVWNCLGDGMDSSAVMVSEWVVAVWVAEEQPAEEGAVSVAELSLLTCSDAVSVLALLGD